MRDWRARVAAACAERGVIPDDDVVEELAQHASAAFDDARTHGRDDTQALADVDALIAAWCQAADVTRRRLKRRAVAPPPAGGGAWIGIAGDTRYACRLMARQAGFSFVTVLTIALGIAATTTLFSVAYGVLMRPLPWPDADRLVRVSESRHGHDPRVPGTISNGTYNEWASDHAAVAAIAGYRVAPASALAGTGEATRLVTCAATPSLFAVLESRPLLGRTFVDGDARVGASGAAAHVVVLSYGLWQERFGARPDAIGRTIRLDDALYTVVGVMPPEFAFPTPEVRAWTPWAMPSVVDGNLRRLTIFGALARLRPGVTPAQAAAEGAARARRAPDAGLAAVALFGGNGPPEIRAVPVIETMTAEVRPALLLLLAGALLLFATATANVAGLQLARATTRRREVAIRAAIGAGVARITRQLVLENVLVGAVGGVLGFGFAAALHHELPLFLPPDFPRVGDIAIDMRVMLCAAAASLAAGLACGLALAMYAQRVDLVQALAEDGVAPAGGRLRLPAVRARAIIMTGQLAIACVLLVGAGLLTRSFAAQLDVDRGYDPRNLLTADLPLPRAYSMQRRVATLEAIAHRLAADARRGDRGLRECAAAVLGGWIPGVHDAIACGSLRVDRGQRDAARRQPAVLRSAGTSDGVRTAARRHGHRHVEERDRGQSLVCLQVPRAPPDWRHRSEPRDVPR